MISGGGTGCRQEWEAVTVCRCRHAEAQARQKKQLMGGHHGSLAEVELKTAKRAEARFV